MKYNACINLNPKGKINVGEFNDFNAAQMACEEISKTINKYGGENLHSFAIEEIKPKWKFISKKINKNICEYSWICSECGNEVNNTANFCCDCGADMRKSDENEFRWKFKAKNGDVFEWKCSECGNTIFGMPTNFCCDCGADMRKTVDVKLCGEF